MAATSAKQVETAKKTAECVWVVGPASRGLDENLLLVRGSASYLLRGFVPLTVPCSATMVLGNFVWRRVCRG